MIELAMAGVISASAALLVCCKLGMRRVLGYDVLADVSVTVAFVWMFAGTYSGMMAGILGGALFSLALYTLKPLLGCEKLRLQRCGLVWCEIEPPMDTKRRIMELVQKYLLKD